MLPSLMNDKQSIRQIQNQQNHVPSMKIKADHNIDLNANGIRNYAQDSSNITSETGDGGILFIQDNNMEGDKDKGQPTIIDAKNFDLEEDSKSKSNHVSRDISIGQTSPYYADGTSKPNIVIDGVDSSARSPKDDQKVDQ